MYIKKSLFYSFLSLFLFQSLAYSSHNETEEVSRYIIRATTKKNNEDNFKVLDSNNNGDLYPSRYQEENRNQMWYLLKRDGDGSYAVQNCQTGKMLDSNGAGKAYTLGANASNYQFWYINNSEANRPLQSVATGRFLQFDPSNDKISTGENSTYTWTFNKN